MVESGLGPTADIAVESSFSAAISLGIIFQSYSIKILGPIVVLDGNVLVVLSAGRLACITDRYFYFMGHSSKLALRLAQTILLSCLAPLKGLFLGR